MPSRILHESFLDSRSIEALSPAAQDAFPRFVLLADDFGCFEVNPRVLWAKGWSRRPDVTEEHVAAWIAEFAERRAADPDTGARLPPVLMVWTHAGRRYAYLTGWHGPHGQRRRAEYDPNAPAGTPGRHGSRRKTPPPPGEMLAAILAGEVRPADGKPPGTDRAPGGIHSQEIPSLSVPARELVISRSVPARETTVSRSVPAPAVAVAVAVAAAAGTGTEVPVEAAAAAAETKTEDPIGTDPVNPLRRLIPTDDPSPPPRWPLADRFRTALADALARTAPHPIGGGPAGAPVVLGHVERALAALGGEAAIAAAVEACRVRVVEAVARKERQPATLKFFLAVLDDLLTARSAAPPRRRRAIGIDPATGDVIEEPAP